MVRPARHVSWHMPILRRVVRMSNVGGLLAVTSIALAGCGAPSFPAGPGTATITWHSLQPAPGSTQGPPQPYTGTVAGIPVSGLSTPVIPPAPSSGAGLSLPHRLALARWTGRFLGQNFALTVTFLLGNTSLSLGSFTVDIDGTFGSQPVRFTAVPISSNSNTIRFQGTIGHHHVTGTIGSATKTGASNEATATFTVTG